MKHIKGFKLFESVDSQFDAVNKVNNYKELMTDDVVNKLNDKNGNINPLLVKDLFIDLFDEDIINNFNFSKFYYVKKYSEDSEDKYIYYVIQIRIDFSDNRFTKENCEKREKYLEKREEVFEILKDHYGHKNLNSRLSKWNISDHERLTSVFDNSFDEIDLWGLALNLQTLK